ncbi:MAG: kinase-like domain-containing protein [Piptocephalis tieghemiana]|nr:MAG: kinase-like domain-containing protein [Piptocephalis tieghemiana]
MGEKVQKEVSTSTGTDGVQVVTERTTTTHKNGKRTVLEVILTDGKETGRKEWELKQDEILAPLGISPSTTTSSQAARGHEMTRTRSVTKGDYYEEEYSSDEEQDSVDETKQADKQESSPVVKGKVKKPETQYRGVVYSRFHNRPTIYSRKDAFKIRGDAKPGTVIMNRYKLGEVMETVKQRQVVRQAQDQKEENKDVTLKFVSNVNTFQLEAVVLRYLSSPYTQELVATYEVPPSRTPYILVKSHHPFTLAQYLLSEERKDTTITTSMVLRQHVRSIVTAVDWCHQHGIAHMDLHPLHFTRDSMDSCTWRLCDFGLAAFVHEDAVREVTSSYAAPEVVRALHARKTLISRASMDLWSLGVTLYELYVGRPLFEDDKMARKTLNADQVAPISLDAIQDPMALAQIKRLVRLDPARRITAGKLLQTEYLSVAEE